MCPLEIPITVLANNRLRSNLHRPMREHKCGKSGFFTKSLTTLQPTTDSCSGKVIDGMSALSLQEDQSYFLVSCYMMMKA